MLITVDGADGVGKSTQAKLLSEWFKSKNISHVLTKEPGGATKECQKIRELLLNPENNISPRAEFFLYLADRAEHVEKCIIPALNKKQWVISDRYIDSTKVYQGIGRGLGIGNIEEMIKFASFGVEPDLTFIMDADTESVLSRAKKSNVEFKGGDRMERENFDFHNKLRFGFLELAKTHERYRVLDATKSIEEIHEQVRQVFKNLLGKNFI